MDSRLTALLREADLREGDMGLQLQAARSLMRAGHTAEARQRCAKAATAFLDRIPARREREWKAAGGCSICKGEGRFIFQGQLRRCPNEVGKRCTRITRAKIGLPDFDRIEPTELEEALQIARTSGAEPSPQSLPPALRGYLSSRRAS